MTQILYKISVNTYYREVYPYYKDKLVNAVVGNNRYLFWELQETYK